MGWWSKEQVAKGLDEAGFYEKLNQVMDDVGVAMSAVAQHAEEQAATEMRARRHQEWLLARTSRQSLRRLRKVKAVALVRGLSK